MKKNKTLCAVLALIFIAGSAAVIHNADAIVAAVVCTATIVFGGALIGGIVSDE